MTISLIEPARIVITSIVTSQCMLCCTSQTSASYFLRCVVIVSWQGRPVWWVLEVLPISMRTWKHVVMVSCMSIPVHCTSSVMQWLEISQPLPCSSTFGVQLIIQQCVIMWMIVSMIIQAIKLILHTHHTTFSFLSVQFKFVYCLSIMFSSLF